MAEAQVAISAIHVGQRFRRDMGDLEALAASIAHVGLLHAIVVVPSGMPGTPWRLVAGQRRLAACARLGWAQVPVRVVSTHEPLAAEHDENTARLDFSPSEAVAIAEALRPAAKAAAESRMVSGRPPSGESPKGRADDQVARAVGMDRSTLAKATTVVKAAEADPALAPLVEHMDDTGKVEPAHRALRSLPGQPTVAEVKAAIASRDAAYDRNYPGWREEEAADKAVEQWLDTWSAIRKAIAKSPPSVVALLGPEDLEDVPRHLVEADEWLDGVQEAWRATQKPRLVTGDAS